MKFDSEIIKVDVVIKDIQCPKCKEWFPRIEVNYCPCCDEEF